MKGSVLYEKGNVSLKVCYEREAVPLFHNKRALYLVANLRKVTCERRHPMGLTSGGYSVDRLGAP